MKRLSMQSDQHVYVSPVAALSRCYLADMVMITNCMADVVQSCGRLGADS